ncbi:unnamed protein product, partial [Allacma fusca]
MVNIGNNELNKNSHVKQADTKLILIRVTKERAVIINREMKLHNDFEVFWTANMERKNIVFKVVARTKGFVGFGLSPQGGMNHADVVMGGVKNGEPYFTDRFSTGKSEPKIDDNQDWTLLAAEENETHTTLQFERELDTCDNEDLPINDDTTKFIWSIGATDDISYHVKRGVAAVNILDVANPTVDVSQFDSWKIVVNTAIPHTDTSYWCTMHKSPAYESKRHIVGFKVLLENEKALEHNHHLILHRCRKPGHAKIEEFYDELVQTPGGLCYFADGSNINDIVDTCQAVVFGWGKGGNPYLFLPENVGFPLNENGVQEYFVLEIHYDNIKNISGFQYETGVEVYTTTDQRENDAGVLFVAHDFVFTMIIPPATSDYVVNGHCSSACTQSQFPENGITVFNVGLHSHLAGRKIKLRQFRDGEELPWLANDDHYDFDYQQLRPLSDAKNILRGDQLTIECAYDSTYKNPSAAVIGGLKTTNEMCAAYLLYWPRMTDLDFCASVFTEYGWLYWKMGIKSVNRDYQYRFDPLVMAPETMAGKRFSEVVSTRVNWTSELKEELQQKTRFYDHFDICMANGMQTYSGYRFVKFPKEFVP